MSGLVLSLWLFGAASADSATWLKPALVTVAAATYERGDADLAKPVHRVTLTRPFLIGRYEVTNEEYAEGVRWALDHGRAAPVGDQIVDAQSGQPLLLINAPFSEFSFQDGVLRTIACAYPQIGPYEPERHPVGSVTWFGAAAYVNWLNEANGYPLAYDPGAGWACAKNDPYAIQGYRLPTEAEWELAARGTDGARFPWSMRRYPGRVSWQLYANSDRAWTQPVGTYSPYGDSPVGAADMVGNVWEWVYDRRCGYQGSPLIDPRGGTRGEYRMVRGGGYDRNHLWLFSAATRSFVLETGQSRMLGFRIAKSFVP